MCVVGDRIARKSPWMDFSDQIQDMPKITPRYHGEMKSVWTALSCLE